MATTDIVERLIQSERGDGIFDRSSVCGEAADEIERLYTAYYKNENEICQTLGKALGYPCFKDDQKNFPGATEEDGVCVGEHVAVTLAQEAANEIERLREENQKLKKDAATYPRYVDRSANTSNY